MEAHVERIVRIGSDLGCHLLHADLRPNRIETSMRTTGLQMRAFVEEPLGDYLIRDVEGASYARLLASTELLEAAQGRAGRTFPLIRSHDVIADLVVFDRLEADSHRTIWHRVSGSDLFIRQRRPRPSSRFR